MGYTYEEFLRDMLEKAKVEQESYETNRREQAQADIAAVAQTYEAAKQQATAQYTDAIKAEEAVYRSLFDANVVDEYVARREAVEAIANSNMGSSGMNNTTHTAISLQRGRADGLTREKRRQAVAVIRQQLQAARANYDRESSEKQASLQTQATEDIQSHWSTLNKEARDRAQSLYEQQQKQEFEASEAQKKREFEASEAQKKREHELAVAKEKTTTKSTTAATDSAKSETQAEEPKSLTEQTFDPKKHGTKFADFDQVPSETAIMAEARHILKKEGNNAAWQYLIQRVNRRYINEYQQRMLAEKLGIQKPDYPSDDEILKEVNKYILRLNRKKARDYIQELHHNYLIGVKDAYKWYDYIGLYPE